MKRNKKHEKRVRKMVVVCALSAIVLTASTYAWFIGMKTVNVAPFEVNIAAIDGLSLSLSGEPGSFADTVTINGENFNKQQTTGVADGTSKNVWGKLIPMSSVGVINPTSSNLEMYEKGSLTPTDGGYRLLASKVANTVDKETRGYVAFDLFVKNLSGNKYYEDVNKLNEEAIYLTTESNVSVSDAGAKAENTGIENSVRVAFAQIGRLEADGQYDNGDTLRSIKCTAPSTGISSICSAEIARPATIWEPNDKKHVQNAINWYNTSCKKRTGEDISLKTSYKLDQLDQPENQCGVISKNTAYPTYAIKEEIKSDYNVDVYDGLEYNKYTSTNKLSAFPYFTDTAKELKGVQRPTFMTLAPKSITKIRVYVYLEGQDIDNYDFASLGKKVSVSFGFSKERFTDEDIQYSEETGVKLPNDVKAHEYVSYAKTGEIKFSDALVTYDEVKGRIVIPRGVKGFTFTDDTGQHTVTSKVYKNYNEQTKSYEDEILDNLAYLNPTYIEYKIEAK